MSRLGPRAKWRFTCASRTLRSHALAASLVPSRPSRLAGPAFGIVLSANARPSDRRVARRTTPIAGPSSAHELERASASRLRRARTAPRPRAPKHGARRAGKRVRRRRRAAESARGSAGVRGDRGDEAATGGDEPGLGPPAGRARDRRRKRTTAREAARGRRGRSRGRHRPGGLAGDARGDAPSGIERPNRWEVGTPFGHGARVSLAGLRRRANPQRLRRDRRYQQPRWITPPRRPPPRPWTPPPSRALAARVRARVVPGTMTAHASDADASGCDGRPRDSGRHGRPRGRCSRDAPTAADALRLAESGADAATVSSSRAARAANGRIARGPDGDTRAHRSPRFTATPARKTSLAALARAAAHSSTARRHASYTRAKSGRVRGGGAARLAARAQRAASESRRRRRRGLCEGARIGGERARRERMRSG